MEGDRTVSGVTPSASIFQSTPSAWRETVLIAGQTYVLHISIHSLRMEGDDDLRHSAVCVDCISIHSLRMEGDVKCIQCNLHANGFQSTPSAWRETRNSPYCACYAPPFQSTPSAWRETGFRSNSKKFQEHFNPLPPHGGRLACSGGSSGRLVISIHSLRMEGDQRCLAAVPSLPHFNPLPPHGGRLDKITEQDYADINFNPLPPHGGRLFVFFCAFFGNHFNPLPPHGVRRRNCEKNRIFRNISIHSLRMEGDKRNSR